MITLQVRNLLIVGYTIVIISVMMMVAVLPVNTVEIQSDVSFIKMLPAGTNPYQKLYDELLSPTVRISSANGIGSGVIINLDADKRRLTQSYILTANHVIANQSSVSVTFYTYSNTIISETTITAFVVATDTGKDLALLRTQINADLQDIIHKAKLAPKNYKPFIFTEVWAVGCSLGFNPRPSQGIITSICDYQRSSASYWEISAPILPGNSGGPVYDANTHEVIGIAVWVKVYHGQLITTMAGIVPIGEIHRFLDGVHELIGSRVHGFINSDTCELTNSSTRELNYQLCRLSEVSSELRISEGARPTDRTDDFGNRASQSFVEQQVTLRKDNVMSQLFELKLGYPLANTPERSKDQWAEALVLNAKRINDKRLLSVPTSSEFQGKIADPSSTGYAERFTTIATNRRTGKTQQMVQDDQRVNLLRSFDKWSQKLNAAFETVGTVVAKKFIDAVNAAKNLFGAGASARTLRATGTKVEGLGAVVIAPYWLTGHKKAVASIRPGIDQVVNGGPANVVTDGVQNAFVSLLTQVLTFSMIQADKSAMDPAVLTALNDRINHIVQTMVDPGLGLTPFTTGGLSHVDIVNDPVLGEILSVAVNQI